MIDKEKQFMDQYDKYLKQQIGTVGLTNPIMLDVDTNSLLEAMAVIDAEFAKIS
ncbi:hypothetical protein [Anaerotignum sp.]